MRADLWPKVNEHNAILCIQLPTSVAGPCCMRHCLPAARAGARKPKQKTKKINENNQY